MESKKMKWINPQMDLKSTFDSKQYSDIIEYANSNTLTLMSSFLSSGISSDVAKELRFASSVLGYFNSSIEDNQKILAAFKLGELYGHVSCLNQIFYEDYQDKKVMYDFQHVKYQLPIYSEPLIKEVLFIISSSGGEIIKNELTERVVELDEVLEDILKALEKHGLVYTREIGNSTEIILTDVGRRLVKVLKR